MRGGDAARRFATGDASIAPPFGVLWTAALAGHVRSPVIAGGRVFAGDGASVHAFDAATGARAWSAPSRAEALAYGDGRVFTLSGRGVTALDAATGAQLWSYEGVELTEGSPVVAGDTVYAQEQELVALDVANGSERWKTSVDGTSGDPAVAGDRIFMQGGCTVAALDRRSGRGIWGRNEGCTGGGGGRVMLAGDRVFPASRWSLGVLRAEDGEGAPGPLLKVVSGDVGLESPDSRPRELIAHDLTAGRELWRSPLAGNAIGLPAHVVSVEPPSASSEEAIVVARDLRTGAERWSARLLDDDTTSEAYTTPIAGQGIVVLPHERRLIALAPASRTTPEPVTIRLRGRPDQIAGRTVGVTGTTGTSLGARATRLEADPHPFDGAFVAAPPRTTLPSGAYNHSLRLERNVRLRVVADDGRTSDGVTVYAYPRLPLRIRQRRGLVFARVRFTAPRGTRARGRRVALYLGRRGSRVLRRLGVGRLGGRGRRGRATFVFRPLPRTRANLHRSYALTCLRGAHRLGLGRADVLSRRCGRRVIRL